MSAHRQDPPGVAADAAGKPRDAMLTESENADTRDAVTSSPNRSRPVRALRGGSQALVAIGAIALLSLVAREHRSAATPSPETPETAPAAALVPSASRLARPAVPLAFSAPRFRLDDPEALEPARAEAARLNTSTGLREDGLAQGGFATIEAPYLRLTLTETPTLEPMPSLFVTLARRAADGQALAVIRTGERGAIETKFGAIETLDITLGGEGKRTCTGFATLRPGPFRLDGWLCAPLGQAPEPRAILCALDKLALNGQASSEMDGRFAALIARRDPDCQSAAVTARDVGGETGSIPSRRTRKNEAKLRQSREARP
ncbi:hypothetical protein [Methylobacterium sp. J-068]|uniref:hypothetical protein n=1 Tax=Methylobacterium sp. J-068 TaxID=2836649 RepID=UPI001FBAD438|nr:hypothetical protein [Methylobacterium sp. J-068]MCJ2036584.1 hypothetical protein [Methylobacterium sp. J-068]